MNKQFDDLMYQSGLTAHGCWDSFDSYDKKAIETFAEMIVCECIVLAMESKQWVDNMKTYNSHDASWNKARSQHSQHIANKIREHFGVE